MILLVVMLFAMLPTTVLADGDGQMDASHILPMLEILQNKQFDYVKGNRFFDRAHIGQMPFLRRIGNMGMGFFIKMASGYWHISDPANGFFAIRRETLQQVRFSNLAKRFFFESSLLIELYYTGARIRDISMPAIYGSEKSNLSIGKTLLTFPPKLLKAHLKRILLRYFVYDFNINSLYILFGWPLLIFGVIFGICKWIGYRRPHRNSHDCSVMCGVGFPNHTGLHPIRSHSPKPI